ncbi:MAG: GTPase domain-containing protein [Anaerolineae bacterium]|nr:GTPase domain-containing protein [Anaerolineae bacterium]
MSFDTLINIPILLIAFIAIVAIILFIYYFSLFQRIKNRAQGRAISKARYVDMVVLGPRFSGKTALTLRWSTPWEQIQDLAPGALWRTSDFTIHEFERPDPQPDPLLGIKIKEIEAIKGRIYDYPGEVDQLKEAVNHLNKLQKNTKNGDATCLLLLFGIGCVKGSGIAKFEYDEVVASNNRYYSDQFLEAFKQLDFGHINRIFIVFNKKDLLDKTWSDDKIALERLKAANRTALERIERSVIRDVPCFLVSANTNEGIVNLLGQVGVLAAKNHSEREDIENRFDRVREWEIEVRK